jgi:hypothetical protein
MKLKFLFSKKKLKTFLFINFNLSKIHKMKKKFKIKKSIVSRLVNKIKTIKTLYKESVNNLFEKICINLIIQKLQKLGIIFSKENFWNKEIGPHDFLNRNIVTILKKNQKIINHKHFFNLLKKNKIFIGNKGVTNKNIFISKIQEKSLIIF